MKIDGQCHCGKISWAAEIDPANVFVCHCSDCQSLSASAFRTVGQVAAEQFEISGEPKVYIKVGDSGARRAQAFCSDCGSGIYASSDEANPAIYNLRLGTCRQRAELVPSGQKWFRSALPWLTRLSEIAKQDGQ